jgi:dUTP pyrophosphatase
MKVNIKKIDERAVIPVYGTSASAGADLSALLDSAITISPGETVMVHSGLSVEIPDGYFGLVAARSSLASKRGLAPANKIGVIDSDYRGELMTPFHNHSGAPAQISPGERFAQLIIVPYAKADFIETDTLTDTGRGAGGFGSTGK